MRIHLHASNPGARCGGLVLIEYIVSILIGLIASGALVAVVLTTGHEMRGGVADSSLQQEAGHLQDQLSALIRLMSPHESVLFSDPVSGKTGLFHSVIIARGETPDFPREQISYVTAQGTVIHDPDRAVSGDSITLFTPSDTVKVKNLYFYPSLKLGGIPDNATLNVVIELDDDGYAVRKNTDGTLKKTSVFRYFTVRMRNG